MDAFEVCAVRLATQKGGRPVGWSLPLLVGCGYPAFELPVLCRRALRGVAAHRAHRLGDVVVRALKSSRGGGVAERGDLDGIEALREVGGPGVGGGRDVGGVLGGVTTREETGEEPCEAQGGDFQEAACGATCSKGRHEQSSK
jgi:hypothetical protein